jgi:arylsulfatase A-like enzyme
VVQARSPEKVWVGPGTPLHAVPSRRAAIVATTDRYTEVPILSRRPAAPEEGEERPAEWLWVQFDGREGWVRRVEPPPGEPPPGPRPAAGDAVARPAAGPDQFETKGDRLTGYVLEYLDEHTSRPLFLFVNYFDPHAAYQAPEEYQRLLDVPRHREALAEAPLWQRFDRGDIAAWGAIIDGEAKVTPEILAYARAAYLAEVAFMDHQVGRLFAALKQHGMWNDALVIVVADHGEMLGEEDYFGHAGRLDPELGPGSTRRAAAASG